MLDVSRTIARSRLPAPTGIDRVERAYIRWAFGRDAMFLAAVDGNQHVLSKEAVRELVCWLDGLAPAPRLDLAGSIRLTRDRRLRQAQSLVRTRGQHIDDLSGGIYLNVGHDNLRIEVLENLRQRGFASAVLIHDLIPLENPEFSQTSSVEKFQSILAVAQRADIVLANSADTVHRLARYMPNRRAVSASLGIDPPMVAKARRTGSYFLCLGTIEPRKNHALLLDVWQELGVDAPHLYIAGRRGWRNEGVFQRLDNDPMIGRTVYELGTPDDHALAEWIAGARALLFPSFAEGFGLPVAEALAHNCPVISSDLPALREVGGPVPEWLAPDDLAAWRTVILEYTKKSSGRRNEQLARMANWRPPSWEKHFKIVEAAIDDLWRSQG